MAKTLDEILKAGKKLDPIALAALQAQAKAAGLNKRVIHLELDLITGQLKSQSTPMDAVTQLGVLEFYRALVVAGTISGRTPVAAQVAIVAKLRGKIELALLEAIEEGQAAAPEVAASPEPEKAEATTDAPVPAPAAEAPAA